MKQTNQTIFAKWHTFITIVLLIPLLVLTSCTKQIQINTFADTDSIPDGFPQGFSFYIFTRPEDHSLLTKETLKKIATILQDRGYRIGTKQTADYYLFFSFDMQSEKRTVHVPLKVTEQVVTKQSNKPKHTSDNAQSSQPGSHYNEQTISSQIIYVPEEHIFFNKTLLIQIYDAYTYKKIPNADPLWQGEAATLDENNDLRDSLDYLLVTALKYFGKNTKKSLFLSINNNDKYVKKLRKSI